MDSEITRLIEVSISISAALSYCFFITTKIPKGFLRLLSLLPVILLFSLIPLRLTTAFNISIATFFLTWLANFKLLLFAFGSGPLCPDPIHPSLSLPLFFAFSFLPIRSKKLTSPKPNSRLNLNLTLAIELGLLPVFLNAAYNQRDFVDSIHPKLILVLYCFQAFLLVDVIIAGCNVLGMVLFGLELEPPSNQPYFATSLQDFWGRRWNLMVTNTLRITIYNPVNGFLFLFVKVSIFVIKNSQNKQVRSFACGVVGEPAAMAAAMMAAFTVSGLMHELLFYYATRVYPSWEMTGFFVLQGVCVVIEFGVKKVVGKRVVLPAMVATAFTVGFVVATSFWLFFPPLMNSGADAKVLAEFSMFFGFVKKIMTLQFMKF